MVLHRDALVASRLNLLVRKPRNFMCTTIVLLAFLVLLSYVWYPTTERPTPLGNPLGTDMGENDHEPVAKISPGEVVDNATHPRNLTTTIVVGRRIVDLPSERWIQESLKDITHRAIYIVDDPTAPLHLDKNQGREAMVYLRYIVEHYDKLDDVTLFFHNRRMAWHNNVLFNQDAAIMVNRLNRQWVMEKGYVPARCELYPGCPSWIKWNLGKDDKEPHPERTLGLFNSETWDEIFPDRDRDPDYLAGPCCSQFAVSRDTIRSVPLEQYKRLCDWLSTTEIPDSDTGRVMEYVWQYLFLNQDEYCPDMAECYCEGYGLCLEDFSQLNLYNDYGWQLEDLKAQLDRWNLLKCNPQSLTNDEEREACEAKNPWKEELAELKEVRADLKKKLPQEIGVMEP